MQSVMSKDMTLGGVSITPMELAGMRRRESWPMNWLLDSLGQKIDGRFPMVGNTV